LEKAVVEMGDPVAGSGRVAVEGVAALHHVGADAEERALGDHVEPSVHHAQPVVVRAVPEVADREHPGEEGDGGEEHEEEARGKEEGERARPARGEEDGERDDQGEEGAAGETPEEPQGDDRHRRPAPRLAAPGVGRQAGEGQEVAEEEHPGEGHPVREGAADAMLEAAVAVEELGEAVEGDPGAQEDDRLDQPADGALAADEERPQEEGGERGQLREAAGAHPRLVGAEDRGGEEEHVEAQGAVEGFQFVPGDRLAAQGEGRGEDRETEEDVREGDAEDREQVEGIEAARPEEDARHLAASRRRGRGGGFGRGAL
jgi:hypothetical protein